jgi:hypothetical protein
LPQTGQEGCQERHRRCAQGSDDSPYADKAWLGVAAQTSAALRALVVGHPSKRDTLDQSFSAFDA